MNALQRHPIAGGQDRRSFFSTLGGVLGGGSLLGFTPRGASGAPAGSRPAGVAVRYGRVDVNGTGIFCREAGPEGAPVILLLHGFPSSSHMSRDLIPRLADRFHVVAPDYPGFGNSDCPPAGEFTYTFDHLSRVMERFLVLRGLSRFTMYVQDYGGPVGRRIAARHPDWIEALVVQNANFYEEGLKPVVHEQLGGLWRARTPETEAPAREFLKREGTIFQYTAGARAPERMNPDAWNMDQWGLDRPGNAAIQLDLLANYHTNLARYPEWQQYLRRHQPPTLVVWGTGDPVFGVENVRGLERDLTDIETFLLDTGHFALEEDVEFIAARMREFLERRLG